MTNTPSHSSTPIIVDANIAVWAVVPVVADIPTLDRLQHWHQQRRSVLAPALWIAEAVSVIRLLVYKKILSPEEGELAVDDLFDLEICTVPITRTLSQAALLWASKLHQARAYDSQYLALAEQEDGCLWTADKRLVNGARQAGFSRIFWIGDDEAVDSQPRG